VWLDEPVLEMAGTMLRTFVPGAFLGFTMMPWWWLTAAAASVVVGVLLWRLSPGDCERRTRWLLVASGASALATVLYTAAVWRATDACRTPPPDGLCMFSGFPFLSLCALYLSIGVVAWIQYARLRT